MKATILAGSGRYQDRWHDFTATAVEVGNALTALGADVRVRAFKPGGVQDVEDADLLVVNSGVGEYTAVSDGPEEDWAEAFDTLRRFRARGGPILALHAASNTLDGLDEWREWIGGRWVRGTSMHPPIGDSLVEVTDVDHEITTGFTDFTLYDEMYSYLEAYPGSDVLLSHSYNDLVHPLVWAVERNGARSVYDALGHGVRAYDAPERLELLRREVDWLVAR